MGPRLVCTTERSSHCVADNMSAQALAHLTQLSLLELGANRVQHLQPLQGLTQLQELWLGDNHISSLGWILSCAPSIAVQIHHRK